MPDPRHMPASDELSPVERRIQRSFEDEGTAGRPLSRRARQTKRTVESYLKAGVLPRYMQRLLDIERGIANERCRVEQAHRALSEACGSDRDLFARRWRARAREWRFDRLNELIREHNEWYPVEAGLAMDPRTRNYVRIRGRSYRRSELGPEWVLEQFPA
jgi:hypothetical protein